MRLDPKIKLSSLLTAIPSAAVALEKLQITTDGNEEKSLEDLCAEHGITFSRFLEGMDDLNWNEEYRA